MFNRSGGSRGREARRESATKCRPVFESLDSRFLPATLIPIANQTVPEFMGLPISLDGGSGNPQTYTVTSSNSKIKASIAQGKYWTFNVSHTSSGSGDVSFNGPMTYQLFENLTPTTVSRWETLVNQGFFTQTGSNQITRVAPGFPTEDKFAVQGGGTANQPGFPFADELVQQLAFNGQGQLAMANSGNDTNSGSFFITTGSPRSLDYKYTIFGQIVDGQTVLDQITKVATENQVIGGGQEKSKPITPINITSSTLSTESPDGVVNIDASNAAAGETATITVTARDAKDNTTITRTFQVTVVENTGPDGKQITERPFLQPVSNQVVGTIQTTPTIQGQTAIFALPFVNPNPPGTGQTFIVRGGVSGNTFTAVQNATATVDANGIVTVVPNPGFQGVINLVVGVGNAGANTTSPSPNDFNLQTMTVTVQAGAEINLQPIAIPGTSSAVINTPSPIQLAGNTANPNSNQTLTYQIVTQPTNGTIYNFDSKTGRFTYVPNPGFQGSDTLGFRVTDVGAPTPNLTSQTATQTIVVGGGNTGAVRVIDGVLVIGAPPRSDSAPNEITIDQVDGKVTVTVNGLLDATMPLARDLTRIIAYGAKASDNITVTPNVTLRTVLNGGQGGRNVLRAGGGPSNGQVWFGQNSFQGSAGSDQVYGRLGRFRVNFSAGNDLVFAGTPIKRASLHRRGNAPRGELFVWRDGVLRQIKTPVIGAAQPQASSDAALAAANAGQLGLLRQRLARTRRV